MLKRCIMVRRFSRSTMHCLRPLLVTLMLLCAGETEPCALSSLLRLVPQVPPKLTSTSRSPPQVRNVHQTCLYLVLHISETHPCTVLAQTPAVEVSSQTSRHKTRMQPFCSNECLASDCFFWCCNLLYSMLTMFVGELADWVHYERIRGRLPRHT